MSNETPITASPKMGTPMQSVITRLTFWYALVTLTILIVLGASLQQTLRATLIHNADVDQMNWMNFVQDRASHEPNPSEIVNKRMVSRLQRASDARDSSELLQSKIWPRVLTVAGQPLSPGLLPGTAIDQQGFMSALKGKTTQTDIQVDGAPVRVLSEPLFQHGQMVAIYQNARPLLDDERIEDLTTVMAAMRRFVWIAVIVSAVTALLLTGRAIFPLRQITRSTSQIGSNNLSERLTVTGSDEFADLAMTFNGMLDRVEDGFRKLEESYEQQRRFTGDASHELRTPLTIIKANASLALSSARTPDEYTAVLRTIDHAADRTNRLIQDLLLLARADAGQLEISKRSVSVDEIVKLAQSHIELMDSGNGPAIIVDPIPDDLTVEANIDMIVRILDNLISNASRHTSPSGEINLSASVDSEESRLVKLVVKDNGEGIAPEHIPFLTRRFYRADESRVRTNGGTGLGLAICKSIVDLHGGQINFESELGKGTTVTVLLPNAKWKLQTVQVDNNESNSHRAEAKPVPRLDSSTPKLSVSK